MISPSFLRFYVASIPFLRIPVEGVVGKREKPLWRISSSANSEIVFRKPTIHGSHRSYVKVTASHEGSGEFYMEVH